MQDYAGNVVGTCRAAAFALASFWLGLAAPVAAQVVDPGLVIQTIPTSLWSPASPDPSGITYRPDTGELLTCDSEVDEMSIFAGVNVWTHSNTGAVNSTASTIPFGNEPTGIAFDPAGGRLWITDDNAEVIYQVDLGPDGLFGTADDFAFDIDGLFDAGCDDLEDVAYDNVNDRLFVASRVGLEICEISPGPNGVFDNAAPLGDDVVTTISLVGTPITAPRGIVYDPFSNTLVIADRGTRDLWELTPAAEVLRRIDVDFPPGVILSGVTIAPGSVNPVLRNYWVTDSAVDNGPDPLENDGRLFEVVAVPLGGNAAPLVDAGPAQSIDWPAAEVALDGSVSDDGHPYPPSAVGSTWSMQSGPGSVKFGDASSPDTSATFSAAGSYLLELLGDDSQLAATDTVAITLVQTFTLSVGTVGAGSVTLDPPGGVYAEGTSVTVTAVPDADTAFVGWSGDLTGTTNPQLVVLNANTDATATFATLYDVAASATGPGAIALDPPGGTYPAGTVVTVTATPDASSAFTGFSGDLTGTTTPQLLTVDADKTVVASFAAQHTLAVIASGPGSVTLDPPGGVYTAGTSVTVSAVPDLDAAFLGFSGDLTGTTNPLVVVVNSNTSAMAAFVTLFDVAASATGPGAIALDPPGGTYHAGTVVTVTATPDSGAAFTGFSGDLTGTTTPQLLTVDADKTVSASFDAQFALSITASGPGNVTLDPPGGVYTAGTSVTVTAAPDPDSAFLGWSGDLAGTTNPQVVVMNASATATFATLFDVAASATGPGAIALDPPGGTYPAGTVVTVTATPDVGAAFTGFSGDLTGTITPQLLTVDADKTVSASFDAQFALSITASGPGNVTLDPPGGVYTAGTSVTVTAAPDPDSAFLGWSGDLTGTTNPQVVVVNANTSATASFAALFDVAASATGPGTIALDPPGGSYPAGTVVTVTATPDVDAGFTGFSGDLTGTTTPQQLTVDSDKTVSASFAPLPSYALSLTIRGSGTVTFDPPSGPYLSGTVVTLTATPTSGWIFEGWTGDATGNVTPLLLTMDADKSAEASFVRISTGVPACGIGPELVALLPPLGWLYRRRRARR